MVTGKLGRHSRDGYPAAAIPLRFFSKGNAVCLNLWMALGGMVVPQLAATSVYPGLFRPGLNRNAVCKLAPTNSKRNRLGLQGLLEEHPRCYCAELILWTSR